MAKPSTRTSSLSYSSYSPYTSRSPSPAIFYGMAVLLIVSLGISIYAVASINQIKKVVFPKTVNVNDFLKKVTGHAGLETYKDVTPLNIIQVTSNNLGTLQSQIQGLNVNHIGRYLIQYGDKIVLYDYNSDKVEAHLSVPQQPQLPNDLFTKLYAHPEVQPLSAETPVGGVLDQASLEQLRQQFPDVYKDAKVGDVLLRYTTALVIYDYNNDKIVNIVSI